MPQSINDNEAKLGLLPQYPSSSAVSVSSDDIHDPVANYHDLSTNEKMLESKSMLPTRKRHRLFSQPLILWMFFVGLVVFSLVVYWLLPLQMNQIPEFRPVFGDCGESPEQSKARGCIYDPLAVTWVRPECYYPEIIEEFIDMGPVDFFSEKSMSNESRVPIEEVIEGLHVQVWAPHKFHSVHCAHVVKKVHHTLANHLPIDSFSLNYEHTKHCQLVLLEELPRCAEPGTCRLNNVIQHTSSCGYVY